MNLLTPAWEIRNKLHGRAQLDELLPRLPAAVRRMGLVRCLQWLEVGEKRLLGTTLHQEAAPTLELDPTIAAAVQRLETCSRRELFRHHRLAVALFDDLATVHRVWRDHADPTR